MNQIATSSIVRLTKLLLVPMSPLQYFLDTPGATHVHCLDQAYKVLEQDGKEDVRTFFQPYHSWIRKGLFWADRGWKNVYHFYANPDKPDTLSWPGASAEAQYYYNQAINNFSQDVLKGMFYLGAALHIIQDMCVPHHSKGIIFDGHQEFEKWVGAHWQEFAIENNGLYLDYTHPSQWVDYNAQASASLYPKVSTHARSNEIMYAEAAKVLIPLTIQSTAGFLNFVRNELAGVTLRLE